ncbi:MAG: type II secretion system ATPase GspE [Myxococcales bacterium]|nr:type II secretion system ATPase GspE [Myxococcales bacterium]MDH5307258.1 type II secretion system ATPase GspE [Myxococcales bacterium]MDH5567102.1 type II secretion system ATPase GspE [Myxococcales bacterium]
MSGAHATLERSRSQRSDLGALLLRTTNLTEAQLEEARRAQAERGGRLIDHLVHDGHVSSDQIMQALSEQLDIPIRAQIGIGDVDESLIERVPITFAKEHGVLPLAREASGAIRVAVVDPLDTAPLDDLRLLFDGAELQLELANQRTVLGAINESYDRGPGSTDALAEDAAEDLNSLASELSHEPQDLIDAADDDAPIVKLVNSLLHNAVKERASDVHIEPFERELRVRFRIDDVLYEPIKPLAKSLQASIVSRIKIMGQLNIAEKRLPQDGRIRLKIAGRDYDVRLSTLPVAYGERVVMRLLPRTQDFLDLEKLGFDQNQLGTMSRLIARPNGIILVTGPTGSGKTTTLYGALARINSTDKNIITIEDPVEIQLPGIGQIEVNAKVGLTFANGLRSVLRQDPNVILVGEIRDLETAEIAIQASLTGHLVFSTLHTNDAPSAITRLVDMGVEPFLVGSSLVAVLAQRLVRVLCRECRVAYEATPEELRQIGVRPPDRPVRLFRAESCAACNYTGYRGRIGIFELMQVDDDIRGLVSQNVDSKTIKNKAVSKGMHALRSDGARKVLTGITSVAEVLRATEEEAAVAQI